MTESAVFRVHPSTAESVESLKYVELTKEVQIVLAFARDYNAGDKNKGNFVSYVDSSFTPEWIQEFKNKSRSTVKFFLSIGGRNAKYPFQIPSDRQAEWVGNAINSLTDIVNHYKFDGIDVYYEHVKSGDDEFVNAIWKVISALKRDDKNTIARVSLAVPIPLKGLYEKLYVKCHAYFDHVVLQTHTVTTPIYTVDQYVHEFGGQNTPYVEKSKIVVGHSILPSDWKNVRLPIFLGAIPKLHDIGIDSISEWAVTDHDTET
ncbi:hypothetical protein K1719_023352 [Acacia pycnantha]|nr:hypothetical protein K1719_023352 [Acacia pycnantha]